MSRHGTTRRTRVGKSPVALALLIAAALTCGFDTAGADQVIADNLAVQGGACVGVDCVNGENLGSDTLRPKENNLRILFQDTSAAGLPGGGLADQSQ